MVRLLWFSIWYTCNLPCSPALVRISRQRKSSAALEYRLALGHEGRAPFHVVLAVETPVDHLLAQRHVARGLVLRHFTDDGLDRRYGERGVGGDGARVVPHVRFQLPVRHHAIDQSHRHRLLGRELARGEENFLGEGRTHHVHQLAPVSYTHLTLPTN